MPPAQSGSTPPGAEPPSVARTPEVTSSPPPVDTAGSDCGNGIEEEGEECEVGDLIPWTKENCVKCRRTLYTTCSDNRPLACPANSVCFLGVCTPKTCVVDTVAEQLSGPKNACAERCPRVPLNWPIVDGDNCLLVCGTPKQHLGLCPQGLHCVDWTGSFADPAAEAGFHVCVGHP